MPRPTMPTDRKKSTYPVSRRYRSAYRRKAASRIREIAWNEFINEPFISRAEDVISIYNSAGTQASPLLIHNNYIQGAYPGDPVSDGYTGSGITVETNSSFVIVHSNQVVTTTNVGIGIAGGHDVQITNNRVILR